MRREQLISYDVKYYDASGNVLNEGRHLRVHQLPVDMTRGDFFYEAAESMGAVRYDVHLMKPEEAKARLKAERKERGEDFVSRVIHRATHAAGLDDIDGMIAYMGRQDKQLKG